MQAHVCDGVHTCSRSRIFPACCAEMSTAVVLALLTVDPALGAGLPLPFFAILCVYQCNGTKVSTPSWCARVRATDIQGIGLKSLSCKSEACVHDLSDSVSRHPQSPIAQAELSGA